MPPRHAYLIVAMLSVSAVYADAFVDRADANGDGFVSLYELRAAHYADAEFNKRIEQSFASYDSNRDGLISEDERQAKPAAPAPAATAESAPSENQTSETAAAPSAGVSPDNVQTTSAAAVAFTDKDTDPPGGAGNKVSLSRAESFILEIDADNSGGASVAELIASGDGKQWFTEKAFEAADINDDRDLDPDELEVLLQSLERRRR
jgi:hypothetical protein